MMSVRATHVKMAGRVKMATWVTLAHVPLVAVLRLWRETTVKVRTVAPSQEGHLYPQYSLLTI